MKERYKIVFFTVAFLIAVVLGLHIYLQKDTFSREKQYDKLHLLGTEEEYGDKENLSLHAEETGGEYDADKINDSENFLLISGEHVLTEKEIDYYAVSSLDDYLLRYLNYYLGNNVYKVTIVEGSVVNDVNYPSFNVTATTKDNTTYYIKCTYRVCAQRYIFHCEQIEKLKNEKLEDVKEVSGNNFS